MIELKQPTLRQLVNRIEELSKDYDCWIEGKGDGNIKLIIQEKNLTLIPSSQDLINECQDERD